MSAPLGRQSPGSAVAALLAIAVGGVPLVGWWSGRLEWTTPHPSLDPIHPLSALGLVLCGTALLLAALRVALPLVRVLGGGALLLASWSLGELVMGVAPGLGLARAIGAPNASMPPNSALALLLAGVGLFCLSWRPFLAAALGALAATLGAVTLLGHLADIEPAVAWRAQGRMAVTAAVGFVVLGAGMWRVSRREEPAHETPESWRRPTLGGLATLAGTLLFWQALSSYEASQIHQTVEWGAERIAAETKARLDAEFQALQALDPEAPELSGAAQLEWRGRVETLLARRPGLRAAVWLDTDLLVDASEPAGWPARSLADLLDNDERLRRSLQLAHGSRRPFVYGPISLSVGELSFWYFAPSDRVGERGTTGALYDARVLFDRVLDEVAPDYEIAILSGDTELYLRSIEGSAPPAQLVRRVPVDVGADVVWTARVAPSRAAVMRQSSRLSLVILVIGVALALVLTAALYLRQVALAQATALAVTNQTLRRQAERSAAAEREVRTLNAELEARVRDRTEELRRSNDDLRQFASFASHELRQPLGTLVVWLDLLKTTQGGRLGDEGKRYVSQMEKETLRMRDLIETQLRWASASAAELTPEWVAVDELVRELEEDLAPRLREAGGRLELGELPRVRADRQQLYNVLRNLVENAIKYRRDDEALVVRVTSRPPQEDEWARPMACVVEVADNGQGFDPEENEAIFKLFERRHRREADGAGVGLAICRRVVERLGGAIRAEGRPGEGATFLLALPEASWEEVEPAAAPTRAEAAAPEEASG